MKVTAITREEVKALAHLCTVDYYNVASKAAGILYFKKKKKKRSTFSCPKTEITTLIHVAVSEHFATVEINHLFALPFWKEEWKASEKTRERSTNWSVKLETTKKKLPTRVKRGQQRCHHCCSQRPG